jgi:hypothetical protein
VILVESDNSYRVITDTAIHEVISARLSGSELGTIEFLQRTPPIRTQLDLRTGVSHHRNLALGDLTEIESAAWLPQDVWVVGGRDGHGGYQIQAIERDDSTHTLASYAVAPLERAVMAFHLTTVDSAVLITSFLPPFDVELRSARGELMWKSLLPVPSGMLDNGDSARWVSPSATWTPPYLLVLFADQRGATRIINRVTLGGTLVSQKTIEAPIGFIGSS